MKAQFTILITMALALSVAHGASPDDGESVSLEVDSRTAQIEREREEKANRLEPDDVGKVERFLSRFKDEKFLERAASGYNGFRPKVGKMATGGGFAIGPRYLREGLLSGQLTASASAQISTRNYQKIDTQWTLPHLAHGRATFDFYAAHRNYQSINFYGSGPQSTKGGRSDYRLEDTYADGVLGVKPLKGITLGGSAGYLLMNIGQGQDSRFISTDKLFTPAQAPGIDRQTNFLRYGGYAHMDYRDNPLGPKNGGSYLAQWSQYQDREISLHDFRRLDVDLEQYIGLFNRTRVFAFRARTTLTDTDAGQSVPFYLQPILGGSDDLRGFRPYRFSGRNLISLNGEYRWETFSGLDMALFVDAGKVFDRRGQLNFAHLEKSVGFGFRFNVLNQVFLRTDVGFSREGFQVWFKFNDAFGQHRPGTASTQPIL
jgi:outer membrane protein assembly factor BamA